MIELDRERGGREAGTEKMKYTKIKGGVNARARRITQDYAPEGTPGPAE